MRNSIVILLLIFALTIASPCAAPAQTPSGPAVDQDERLVVGTNEVMLDAVVRDKKGRVVKDLQPSDFEVYEDGVRQQIQSFRLVSREVTRESKRTGAATAGGAATAAATATSTGAEKGSTEAAAPARSAAPTDPMMRTGAVAFVFDRLSPEGRARARQAALAYLSGGLGVNDFAGVFGIDLSLRVLQPFTNNEQAVKLAIERAATHSSSSYASNTGRMADISQQQAQLQANAAQETAGIAASGSSTDTQGALSAMGSNALAQTFNDMTARSLETFQMLEHNQQGFATTNGLLAIVNSLRRLPGRKVLIFFSEGVSIPPAVQAHFRSVISNANRANVSIYAVDAAGLRTFSSDVETGRAMTALGRVRMNRANSAVDGTGGPMTRDLERNEDLLRANPESGLGQLANETGGLLIANTNDPGAKLRQVDEDLHSYYALTYVPKNQEYDGRFRQISLKLNRPNLEVQTRKGYYAINAGDSSPVLAYEAPALAVLGSGNARQPNAFPMHAAAFSFPQAGETALVPVLVEVPAGSINFSTDAEKKTYHTDFAVVVLLKDEAQRVVRKLSEQYLLTGPLDKLDAAKRGEILFYRETDLPPGRYTMAAVVYDAKTGQASTGSGNVVVPDVGPSRLQMSSIVFIKRAERLGADQQKNNPFHFGEVLLYPNLGESLRKSGSKELAFFLTLWTAPDAKSAPRLTLELMQNNRPLASTSLTPPAPDQQGRIQYASAIPVEKLQPGDYELKITARDGQHVVTRSEHFTIEP